MNKRELTKLQVRAEVLAVIQQLTALDETSRESQLKQVRRLGSIANMDYVLECLIRELTKGSYEQREAVSQLLLEYGSLDKLSGPLWNIIKDHNTSDEIKDAANVVLRNLGDTSDPALYLSYLKNPQELIDKETERMLKLASLSPEAQIDFLDFLFSLPSTEQINLIESLKDDYPGEYLTSIFMPAIAAKPNPEVSNILIKALGNTRSSRALSFLEDLHHYSTNEIKKKAIKKSINMLKLAGIKSEENDSNFREKDNSQIYNCYVSTIDGIGNQGIIISRLKSNDDVSLFSVVINDTQGIMDCFGFGQISQTDFIRIIKKFQEGTPRICIPPEYCKARLDKAEIINKSLELPIPYEYSAWKVLAEDIGEFYEDPETIITVLKNDSWLDRIDKLYDINDFYCWFIEDDDHPQILSLFEESLTYIIDKLENATAQDICNYIDLRILESIDEIFDDNWKTTYYLRLANEAYLMKHYDMQEEARLAATAAWALTYEAKCPLKNNKFVIKLMHKSIAEFLLRFQFKIDDNSDKAKTILSESELLKYKTFIDEIFNIWQVDF